MSMDPPCKFVFDKITDPNYSTDIPPDEIFNLLDELLRQMIITDDFYTYVVDGLQSRYYRVQEVTHPHEFNTSNYTVEAQLAIEEVGQIIENEFNKFSSGDSMTTIGELQKQVSEGASYDNLRDYGDMTLI